MKSWLKITVEIASLRGETFADKGERSPQETKGRKTQDFQGFLPPSKDFWGGGKILNIKKFHSFQITISKSENLSIEKKI